MGISCCCFQARDHRGLDGDLRAPQRPTRSLWPAASAEDGGVERSCCLARNAAAWRQGKKIANEPLRVKVGERSERIVARDPPAKGRYGRGHKQLHRRSSLRHPATAATATSQKRDRTTSA